MYTTRLMNLSDSALRLYLYLTEAAAANPSFKMTFPVLAEAARIPVSDVVPAQAQLVEAGLIETEKAKVVRVGEHACSLRFTKDRDRELDTLRAENALLHEQVRELRDGDASGLADQLSPQAASVVYAAEDVLGRALTYQEAWYLGGLVETYKSPRVRDVIYTQRRAKNPLKAAYAILKNGAKGKPFKEKEETPVRYPKLEASPWR